MVGVRDHHRLRHCPGAPQLGVAVRPGVDQDPALDQDRRAQRGGRGDRRDVHCSQSQPSRGIGQAAPLPSTSVAHDRGGVMAKALQFGGHVRQAQPCPSVCSRRRWPAGSSARSPSRPRPSSRAGRRSPAASTRCSWRRPARARRWPPSWPRIDRLTAAPPARHPGALRLAAAGAQPRHREEPAGAACRHRLRPPDLGRPAHRRHQPGRAGGPSPPPARHPDHHPGVALPDADLGRPGDAGRRRDGDRGRDPRHGRRQARRPPGALAGAARPPLRAARRSGSGSRPPSGRWPRWPPTWAASAAR